jgi:DNA modification methylase
VREVRQAWLLAQVTAHPMLLKGQITLWPGDCVEEMKGMSSGIFDAVVTDPPYGINYQANFGCKPARFPRIIGDKAPAIAFLPEAFRLVKDGGALLSFCHWRTQEAFRAAIEAAGFSVKCQVIWDRGHHGLGNTSCTFGPQHDVIWFATKGKFRFPGKRPKSVIRSMRVAHQRMVHPTEKPVDLMRQLVRAVTPENGLVLDPFAGSGSTGVAALEEGRRAILIELDPTYQAVILRRFGYADINNSLSEAA